MLKLAKARLAPSGNFKGQSRPSVQPLLTLSPTSNSSRVKRHHAHNLTLKLAMHMQLDLRVVGVDLKVIVQGRELVSLQLLDAALSLDMAPDPPPSIKGHSMSLALRIVDISLRDLQVHSNCTPLQCNHMCDVCSLSSRQV